MNEEIQTQIRQLKREVTALAEYDDRLRRAVRRSCDSVFDEAVLIRERRRVADRTSKALREIRELDPAAIDRDRTLTVLASWYPQPIKLITFFGIDTVAKAAA